MFEVTNRCSTAEIIPGDDHVAPDGLRDGDVKRASVRRLARRLSLDGPPWNVLLLQAFIHIVDSMFSSMPVAQSVSSDSLAAADRVLELLIVFTCAAGDHNGFSHQDPGFIDHVVNKKAEVIRVYLPPDANTLLSVTDHCLRSRNCVNVIVAGKQPAPQWLNMDAAIKHCAAGLGIWPWASNDRGGEPDVVMACCGDVPTLETLAAVELLRKFSLASRSE